MKPKVKLKVIACHFKFHSESSESRSRSKGKSKSRRHVERTESGCQTDEKITLLYLPPLEKLAPKFVSRVPVTSPAQKDQRTELVKPHESPDSVFYLGVDVKI